MQKVNYLFWIVLWFGLVGFSSVESGLRLEKKILQKESPYSDVFSALDASMSA